MTDRVPNRVSKRVSDRAMPLRITLVRTILAPLFLALFLLVGRVPAGSPLAIGGVVSLWVIFGLIIASDLLDGFVARKYRLVSNAGKVMDPSADILVHFTYFICFVHADILWVWLFALLIYREIIIVSLRILLALKDISFAANAGGKLKTVLFALATISGLLVFSTQSLNIALGSQDMLQRVTTILFIVATFASYISLFVYGYQVRNERLLPTRTHTNDTTRSARGNTNDTAR